MFRAPCSRFGAWPGARALRKSAGYGTGCKSGTSKGVLGTLHVPSDSRMSEREDDRRRAVCEAQ